MDFLDPKKQKTRKIRLIIGHMLMVILVIGGTFILVLQAYGFDFDRKSGEVIQNGLVFVDSAPDGATIKLNGQEQPQKTNIRLSLPEGVYDLEISKPGYRNWSRSFELDGGKVERFTYPALYLTDLKPEELKTSDTAYAFATESLDRRKIVLQPKNNFGLLTIYDLGNRDGNDKPIASDIALPAGLFSAAPGDHQVTLVEWSTDNKNILVRHNWATGQEFVILNIDEPARSFNFTQFSGQNPAKLTLYDKKVERFHTYDPASKILSLYDTRTKQFSEVRKNVISYKSHADNAILMSIINADPAKTDIVLSENGKDYVLRQIPTIDSIPLDYARSGKFWYAVVGVQAEQKTYVYKNPIDYLNSNKDPEKTALLAFKSPGPIDQVSFSQNTRFIMAQSGQHLNVYDTELEKRYGYTVKQALDVSVKLEWMDGHRLIARTGGNILVFDFNGINAQTLVPTDPTLPVIFDRDYTELYTFAPSTSNPAKFGFYSTQLRLEEDK